MKRISLGFRGLGFALFAGCVTAGSTPVTTTSNSIPTPSPSPPPPPVARAPVGEQARQAHIAWENHVMTAADTQNGGRPLPGIAGRLYLFGENVGYPLRSGGTVTVVMHEVKKDGSLKQLADWTIDPVTLQRLGRKDMVGWGYTLFLPWESHNPEIRRVQLQAKFTQDGSTNPLFTPASTVTLNPEGPPPEITTKSFPVVSERAK